MLIMHNFPVILVLLHTEDKQDELHNISGYIQKIENFTTILTQNITKGRFFSPKQGLHFGEN